MVTAHDRLLSEQHGAELAAKLDADGLRDYRERQADEAAKAERLARQAEPGYGKTPAELRMDLVAQKAVDRTRNLQDLMKNGVPETNWIVENLLPEQGITLIGGEPGAKKTMVSQHLALCVATGQPFLEQFHTQQGTVLIVDEENHEKSIIKRFSQLMQGHGIKEQPSCVYVTVGQGVQLDTEEGRAILNKLIVEYKPAVVVLDSMVRFLSGDENDAKDVREVFMTLKALMDEFLVSFVVLHHLRKDNGKGSRDMGDLRGSGDFAAMVDVILLLSKAKGSNLKFTMGKNRHIPLEEVQPWEVKVENPGGFENAIRFEYDGLLQKPRSRGEKAAEAIREWLRADFVTTLTTGQAVGRGRNFGHSRNAVLDALDVLIDEGVLRSKSRGIFDVDRAAFVVVEEKIP